MGRAVLDVLGTDGEFVPCMHSVGAPLAPGQEDVAWPCNPDREVHRPLPRGARDLVLRLAATAATRCSARSASRCASPPTIGTRRGLARRAHADPRRRRSRTARRRTSRAAFPSACGKTNFAMLIPPPAFATRAGRSPPSATTSPGSSRARTASSTRSTRRPATSASRPGTSYATNPNAMESIRANTIFTNVALTDDGDVWWEGMDGEPPAHAIDWQGNDWTPDSGDQGRAPERPLHRARHAEPGARPGLGRPEGRADHGVHLRRPPLGHDPARRAELQLGLRRLHGRHDGLGDDRRRVRQAGRGAPRPVRDAAVLRLPHGRLLQPLARRSAATSPTRRGSSRSTGSAATTTASSSGPASARTCAC